MVVESQLVSANFDRNCDGNLIMVVHKWLMVE